jgi:hypothetical protein
MRALVLALALAGAYSQVSAQADDLDLTSIAKFKDWMNSPKPAGAPAVGPDGQLIGTYTFFFQLNRHGVTEQLGNTATPEHHGQIT